MEVLVWLEAQASKNPILSILLPVIALLWLLGGVKERQDMPVDLSHDYYRGQAQVWREVAMMLFADDDSPDKILRELMARRETEDEETTENNPVRVLDDTVDSRPAQLDTGTG